MEPALKITNSSRGTLVAARCRLATGLLQRIFGLHLLPQLHEGEGLLLREARSIDTLFMGYAIDLVFVDGSRRVTKIVERLRPWRMVAWAGNASRDCLELPAGAVAASSTAVGDQLRFEELP